MSSQKFIELVKCCYSTFDATQNTSLMTLWGQRSFGKTLILQVDVSLPITYHPSEVSLGFSQLMVPDLPF